MIMNQMNHVELSRYQDRVTTDGPQGYQANKPPLAGGGNTMFQQDEHPATVNWQPLGSNDRVLQAPPGSFFEFV